MPLGVDGAASLRARACRGWRPHQQAASVATAPILTADEGQRRGPAAIRRVPRARRPGRLGLFAGFAQAKKRAGDIASSACRTVGSAGGLHLAAGAQNCLSDAGAQPQVISQAICRLAVRRALREPETAPIALPRSTAARTAADRRALGRPRQATTPCRRRTSEAPTRRWQHAARFFSCRRPRHDPDDEVLRSSTPGGDARLSDHRRLRPPARTDGRGIPGRIRDVAEGPSGPAPSSPSP